MRFLAFPSNPKRRRASLAGAVHRRLPTQGQAPFAEHPESTRSVCLPRPPWERGRLARPEVSEGRYSGLRPQLRTGRPRSQGGFASPKNVQSPIIPLRCQSCLFSAGRWSNWFARSIGPGCRCRRPPLTQRNFSQVPSSCSGVTESRGRRRGRRLGWQRLPTLAPSQRPVLGDDPHANDENEQCKNSSCLHEVEKLIFSWAINQDAGGLKRCNQGYRCRDAHHHRERAGIGSQLVGCANRRGQHQQRRRRVG